MPVIAEITSYGYRAVLSDPLTTEDIRGWVEGIRDVLRRPHGFGQLVDLRQTDQARRDPQVAQVLQDAMMLIRGSGLLRTAVIVPDQVVARRLRRAAQRYLPQTGERFIDAREEDWEQAALGWIRDGAEPWETYADLRFLRQGPTAVGA